MNELIEVKNITAQEVIGKIYEIRGRQVMLDCDLGILYGCANGSKTINQAVKRNIERFPEDFYFQLTEEEFSILRSQFGTANRKISMARSLPYAFTEQGVAMLSSVLRTHNASIVSVAIMRAFVIMKGYLVQNKDIYQSLNNINVKLDNVEIKQLEHDQKFLNYDKDIKLLFSKFDKKVKTESVFFNGQIYDAYSKILDIMKKSKERINYS